MIVEILRIPVQMLESTGKLSDMHRQRGIYTAVIVQKDGFGTMEGGSGTICLGGLPGVILETDGISPENL